MQSNSNNLLAPSTPALPFLYLVVGVVSVALTVALIAALGLAWRLPLTAASHTGAWLPPPETLLDAYLLILLGSVAVLSILALWTVARYERRLQVFAESRARNRQIVDNMLDGAIHLDAAGQVAGMNAAAERMFGYRAAEMKGQPISLLLSHQPRTWLETEMQEHPYLGLPPALIGLHRVEGRRRDGTSLPVALAVTEVHVGGCMVYTAVVRELGDSQQSLPELGAATLHPSA